MLFANPKALLIMAMVLPALVLLLLWGLRRRHMLVRRFGQWVQVSRLLTSSRPRVHVVRSVIWLLAVTLMFLAVARPKFGDVEETVLSRGVDVIIAVDTSASMLASDIEPTRLKRAKDQLTELIARLSGHRIGLISFAGTSMLQCPLTLDQTILNQMLSIVDHTSVGVPGTAIANTVQLAIRSFDEDSSRHRVLVLLTDGEDHEGNITEAAQEAAGANVIIYAIGIGTDSPSTVPQFDSIGRHTGFLQHEDGSPVQSRLNTLSLLTLAGETGGRAFETASLGQVEVDIIAREIDALPQSALEEEQIERKEDQFQLFLLPAILLLLFDSALLTGRVRRRRKMRAATVASVALAAMFAPGASHTEESAAVLNNRGVALQRSGDLEGALEALQQAQVEDPSASAITLNIGNVLNEQGNLEEAEAQYSRVALRADADLASDAHFNLGTVLIQQAQEQASQGDLRGAIENVDAARGSLRTALLRDSQATDAQVNLEMANELKEIWTRRMQEMESGDNEQNQPGEGEGEEGDPEAGVQPGPGEEQEVMVAQPAEPQEDGSSDELDEPTRAFIPPPESPPEEEDETGGEGESDAEGEQPPPLTQEELDAMANRAQAEAMLDDLPFSEDSRGMQNLMNVPRQPPRDGPAW